MGKPAKRISKETSGDSEREREHHGDHGPDEHPGGQLEDEGLLQLELVEPLEQLRLEQHHLEPGPLELQPSVPELLLLLQDDRALRFHQEEENLLVEQCLELNGQEQV